MTTTLLRTALFDCHLTARAKLVDFAGWEMPIHYGSQLEEHQAVRTAAGLFDVSHMLAIDVQGPDALRWLQWVLANDVARLKTPGQALYSCLLHESGGIIDDLIVYYLAPAHYRLVVNAGCADKDLAWLQQQHKGYELALQPRRDLAMLALQGPQARAIYAQRHPAHQAVLEALRPFQAAQFGDWLVARTGYTGEDGYEITLPQHEASALWQGLLAEGARPCGLGCRDTLRLEAGMNLYGQDMDENVTPLEAGLAWTLVLDDERNFIGKAALRARGQQPDLRQFTGLLLEGRGVLRAHQRVMTAQGEGEITSGTFSPTLNQGIALARLPAAVQMNDVVEVDIRGRLHAAKVVKPPFVRHGKILVS